MTNMVKKTWVEARVDFDRMIYTNNYGAEIEIVIREGRVCTTVREDPHSYVSFSDRTQTAYQEYMSKLIEQELLKEE